MATPVRMISDSPHLLRNAREFRAAVREVDALLDAEGPAEDKERLAFLSVLVQEYEDRTNPLDEARGSPQEIVAFMLEQRGMRRTDLAPLMGGRARTCSMERRRRPEKNSDTRALRAALGIPADMLID
jgi:HTH-type transcriptional regulator/antitoxin HigA